MNSVRPTRFVQSTKNLLSSALLEKGFRYYTVKERAALAGEAALARPSPVGPACRGSECGLVVLVAGDVATRVDRGPELPVGVVDAGGDLAFGVDDCRLTV